jgi:molecular chaperone DnaJ
MITVAPGTETGAKVRLKGQGEPGGGGGAGGAGGKPGDLLVTFEVESDRFFRREGLDLLCEVPINLAQAVLGTTVRVRTIDGKKVVLRIPAGTQAGRRFRIRGLGVAKGDRRGDQLVEVRVRVPETLTPEQQALFRKFAEAAGLMAAAS